MGLTRETDALVAGKFYHYPATVAQVHDGGSSYTVSALCAYATFGVGDVPGVWRSRIARSHGLPIHSEHSCDASGLDFFLWLHARCSTYIKLHTLSRSSGMMLRDTNLQCVLRRSMSEHGRSQLSKQTARKKARRSSHLQAKNARQP